MNAREYTNRYTAAQVTMVDRERLLLLVLEGGLRFLRQAREALVAGDLVRFGDSLGRAQAIIAELRGTLDHSAGGAITRDLARLYDFMLFHLTEGNAEKSVRHIDEVLSTFTTVADAFQTALAQTGAPTDASGAA